MTISGSRSLSSSLTSLGIVAKADLANAINLSREYTNECQCPASKCSAPSSVRDSARDEGREDDMDEMESSVLVALLLRLCTGTYRPDEGEAGEADLMEKGADDMAEED